MNILMNTPYSIRFSNVDCSCENSQHNIQIINTKYNQCKNLNKEIDTLKQVDDILRKKNKRKQYKKRRRQRDRQNQKIAKFKLGQILQQIYNHQTTFKLKQNEIACLLIHLEKGDKFHMFLNHVIRDYVNNVQTTLWFYAQGLLQDLSLQSQENKTFYLRMVNKIYEQYQSILQSSKQIQKIIDLYVKMTSDRQYNCYEDYNYRDLDKSIFNYLISSDKTIADIMKRCNQKITNNNQPQKEKLLKINQIMKFCQNRDYNQQYQVSEEEQSQQLTQKSTSIGQSQLHDEKQQKQNSKRKKIKDSQIKYDFNDVIERLNNFSIDQNSRICCRVTTDWIKNIEKEIIKNIKQ